MQEVYISLEEAATYEGLSYKGLWSRMQRTPQNFKTQLISRTEGGKPLVQVAVSSLTPKARRAYRAAQKVVGGDTDLNKPEQAAPWYLEMDLNHFLEGHRQEYSQAVTLSRQVRDFLDYGEAERTAHAEETAQRLGVSTRTLYRHAGDLLEAEAWARMLEDQDGHSRDYFRALALCRKPREGGTFPSLRPEQKAMLENIWFKKGFAANRPTIELTYTIFREQAEKQGWSELPSVKTVGRYIQYLMDRPGGQSAYYLAANGTRAWKNQQMVKCKRDSTSLSVLEYVVADAHTFDFWVSYTYPNGKVKAIRPVLVAWMDVRTRSILGTVLCEHSNTQVVKESFLKLCYTAGVPRYIHIDNGKDFANLSTLGQDRKVRYQQQERVEMDSETMGFYLSMGGEEWSRSLPFQPWAKDIERGFGTICEQFSKRFDSYTGTLTGSKTDAKVRKDIPGMLARGELLSLEECFQALEQYLKQYHHKAHRGLKDQGEHWTKPAELFEYGERYEKSAPPREFAAMLLMKAAPAAVSNQGIQKFNTLYNAEELGRYVGLKVGIKWDIDDVTKLYVYDKDGRKICEAYSAEALAYGDHVSQEALEAHVRRQHRQFRETRELLEEMETPYEVRIAEGRAPGVVGKLDLMIGHAPQSKVVTLPTDKEYRGEMEARSRKRSAEGNAFLSSKAGEALDRLRAINE